jgi:hypothetical protein
VLSRFFVSLAVVGTWGDQPPSGVVGGGKWQVASGKWHGWVLGRLPLACATARSPLTGGGGGADGWRVGIWCGLGGPPVECRCEPLRPAQAHALAPAHKPHVLGANLSRSVAQPEQKISVVQPDLSGPR